MVVADPRPAQRRILRPGAKAHVAGAGGKALETFEHAGDVGIGKTIIAVTACFSCSIRPPASSLLRCELAVCGVMPPSCANSVAVSARPVISAVSMLARADRRPMRRPWRYRDLLHSSMLAEALTSIKPVGSISSLRGALATKQSRLALCSGLLRVARNDGNIPRGSLGRHRFHPLPARSFKRAMFEQYAKRWLTIIPGAAAISRATGCRMRAPTTLRSR